MHAPPCVPPQTVEGLLDRAIENLDASQPLRRDEDPASADAIDAFLARLRGCKDGAPGSLPFSIHLDDPSGNSFLENPFAPRHDPSLRVHYYRRTTEQVGSAGGRTGGAGRPRNDDRRCGCLPPPRSGSRHGHVRRVGRCRPDGRRGDRRDGRPRRPRGRVGRRRGCVERSSSSSSGGG